MQSATMLRLQRQRNTLFARLSLLVEMIDGSLFERTVNGKQRFYLSCMEKGVQRQHYVAHNHCQAVRKGVKQYKELIEIIRTISQINLQLIRMEKDP